MSSVLGEHASKWMEIVLSFIDDPSKYGLPRLVFDLPDFDKDDVSSYLNYARQRWRTINPRTTLPYENLEDQVPYWMVFTLPRRPAILYLAVWDEVWETKNLERYQDIQYYLQELLQNFIREELQLFNLVRPFRKRTGHSVLNTKIEPKQLSESTLSTLTKYTSPQKVLHQIADFVRDRTIQSGIAYILMIEKFSRLVSKTKSSSQLYKITTKFVQDLGKLERVDFSQKIPSRTKAISQKEPTPSKREPEVIEFEKIILQEYDGYVEVSGISDDESRNFRIYNCIEEDLLREEMYKNRNYPIRRIVSEILEERYSKPTKEYKLKYGVKIELLPPNWV